MNATGEALLRYGCRTADARLGLVSRWRSPRRRPVKLNLVRMGCCLRGAGPCASQYLVLAAKAKAILAGATHVMPEHIQAVALPVLRHRIITNFNAEADGITTDDIIRTILEDTPVDDADANTTRRMDAVMR